MRSPALRQTGISLVEIMIALVLSLFLSAGVIEIYLASKQSYRTQEGYSRLQENGRYAIDTLTHFIRLAGYKPLNGNVLPTDSVAFAVDGVNFAGFVGAGQVIAGSNGAGSASDTIALQYQDDDLMGDCGSPAADTAGPDLKRRSIVFAIDANQNLTCATVEQNLTTLVATTTAAQPLLEGVENMQIQYGIDTDAPADGYANQYKAADALTAAEWLTVVSVRVALLLNTVGNISGEADTDTFSLLGASISAPAATDPNRFMRRHPFTITVSLRNRTP